MSKILSTSDLKAGDVILCFENSRFDPLGKKIQKVTGSEYVHAGIFLGDNMVVESMASGLTKESISNVIARYDHVAIIRRHDAWCESNIVLLRYFAEKALETGCKYNFSGVMKFKQSKQLHEATVIQQLEDYFSGNMVQKSPLKHQYFCSEFVVDCFIATGFIDQSAAVYYNSETFAPGDLGKDPTFGYFLGYISDDENYQVPEADEFYNQSTWEDIFESKI